MRIPLDYYRILGLPIQATAEQLQQAHRDRVRQLPRREYSEVAIAARKQLIDEAYAVLSDPEQRQAYDATFLAKTYELDSIGLDNGTSGGSRDADAQVEPHSPSIEIDDKQFVGALLILQELGEYELVLKLSQPHLSSGRFALKLGRFGEPQLVGPDILLTVALSCLELGREQWQQGQYENAAASLETGQDLLLQEGLFATVRGEMQADLYKLRPYRILELLSKKEENAAERRKGLQLLRDMFQERGGIDGTGDDQSGLNVDDFLRFIQQLRSYLTAAEQQHLFEAEARRPSAVATYLAAYAFIASGFAYRQPALIRQAKLLLLRLGKRQDVHLEQSICALLLGQTEEASQALELSQEYETLDTIREQSKGSPDLLPGLCQYAERWLADEVYPHFRDLASKQGSLKDYFADKQVQAYLEALPAEEEEAANQWVPVQSQPTQTPKLERKDAAQWDPVAALGSRTALSANLASTSPGVAKESPGLRPLSSAGAAALGAAALNPGSTSPDAEPPIAPREAKRTASERTPLPPAIATSRGAAAPEAGSPPRVEAVAERRSRSPRSSLPLSAPPETEERPNRRAARSSERSSARLLRSVKVERLIGLVVLLLLALFALLFLSAKIFGLVAESLGRMSGPALLAEQPSVRLDSPPVPIPEPIQDPLTSPGPISEPIAQQVIQKWLSTKSAAMGANHAVDRLSDILVGSALSKWQQWATELKQENSYYKYKHNLKVKSVDASADNPDRAKVEAEVSESAELYRGGRAIDSRNDTLQVRYDLVRQDGQWRIQSWDVLR